MNATRLQLRRRFTAFQLLVALALLFVSFPFVEKLAVGDLIISILFTIVLISSVRAIEGHGPLLVIAMTLAFLTLAGRWIHHYWPTLLPSEVFLIGGIVFVLFVVVRLLRFILRAPTVDEEVLSAAVSAYLLLGLLWTLAYWLVAEFKPGAFAFNVASGGDTSMNGFNGIYFSFVTLCTVGYGDITPVASTVRMLAAAEAITGLLYVGILIARLVAIHTSSRPDSK